MAVSKSGVRLSANHIHVNQVHVYIPHAALREFTCDLSDDEGDSMSVGLPTKVLLEMIILAISSKKKGALNLIKFEWYSNSDSILVKYKSPKRFCLSISSNAE